MSDTLGWKLAEKSRGGKLPTLLFEGWKVADTKIRSSGKLPTGEHKLEQIIYLDDSSVKV